MPFSFLRRMGPIDEFADFRLVGPAPTPANLATVFEQIVVALGQSYAVDDVCQVDERHMASLLLGDRDVSVGLSANEDGSWGLHTQMLDTGWLADHDRNLNQMHQLARDLHDILEAMPLMSVRWHQKNGSRDGSSHPA